MSSQWKPQRCLWWCPQPAPHHHQPQQPLRLQLQDFRFPAPPQPYPFQRSLQSRHVAREPMGCASGLNQNARLCLKKTGRDSSGMMNTVMRSIQMIWRKFRRDYRCIRTCSRGRSLLGYGYDTRGGSRIVIREAAAEFWPQSGALSAKFAHNRGFSLKIVWKLHDFSSSWGQGAWDPRPGSACGHTVIPLWVITGTSMVIVRYFVDEEHLGALMKSRVPTDKTNNAILFFRVGNRRQTPWELWTALETSYLAKVMTILTSLWIPLTSRCLLLRLEEAMVKRKTLQETLCTRAFKFVGGNSWHLIFVQDW